MKRRFWIGFLLLQLVVLCPAQTSVSWLTRAYDNQRSGWNNQETTLTQANVAAKGIVRTTIIPVVGDARGMEAQPLILPGVTTAQGIKDVMLLPSMADVVRAVDAHTGAGIWEVTLGFPVTGNQQIDGWGINQHWGCLSTGVIDPDLQRLYQVCQTSPDATGNPLTSRYFMFVLNVADGTKVVPPVMLTGGTPDFNAVMRKQRASLVETNINGVKTVFGCAGTVSETGAGAAGYVFAFDVTSNSLTAMQALTAGEGAGCWMGGSGPSADSQGYLYLLTGNGDFDGATQWGESLLKLRYTPPMVKTQIVTVNGAPVTISATAPSTAKLTVIDNWTPWTDLQRAGNATAPAAKLSGMSAPSEAVRPVNVHTMSLAGAKTVISATGVPLVYPQMASGPWSDEDWGSSGPACLFQLNICIAAGKDGIAYPVHSMHMGQTRLTDLLNPKTNCAKLAAPPVWLTMSPGPVDPCPTNPATLNFFPWGDTAHLHMTPVQMYDPLLKSWTIFAWGENSQLHKWRVSSTGALTYVAQSHEYASADVRGTPPGGMAGGECAGSSNGGDPNSALLVCVVPYGDVNTTITNSRILIYDPIHLAADGYLKVLWDSQPWNWTQTANKFMPPEIDGGEIIIPNYSGGVLLLTLGN